LQFVSLLKKPRKEKVWQKRSAEIVIEYGEILERKSFRYPPEKRIFVPQKIQLFFFANFQRMLEKIL